MEASQLTIVLFQDRNFQNVVHFHDLGVSRNILHSVVFSPEATQNQSSTLCDSPGVLNVVKHRAKVIEVVVDFDTNPRLNISSKLNNSYSGNVFFLQKLIPFVDTEFNLVSQIASATLPIVREFRKLCEKVNKDNQVRYFVLLLEVLDVLTDSLQAHTRIIYHFE